ncbi:MULTISPECIES: 1-hydroxycarotenoid 3,4-desaturase CrtD [Rhodopseudomonas]|uniref:CrtD protein n=1 Tax=Rhodopseudomonas palustris TaxID=1076 RepID=A0A0D7EME7_RHOPL|nr:MULTISPECIES: 1-hydroxycarotenoid 3,4-desaturase CrtD [Rhodopseudomonas]KIZ41705.1 CrtD protein [Rhodopseudomonas palustris]MDF3811096.1 phytoene desaturase family protein [Rhodopseudomonas sp. BAL398]WOK20402.1 phytoene desaturase family protein [Rhodopseudomonas sp. BAL398]
MLQQRIVKDRVVVVGAGMAGLAAALALSARGLDVTVLERGAAPGGKLRQVGIGPARIDSGPTVFTMRWVFEELFAAAGRTFTDHVRLRPLQVLARHAWDAQTRLDLFADEARSADAIGDFAGSAEAKRYRRFCADSRRIYQILETPFLRATSPSLPGLLGANGLRGMMELHHIRPFTTMWKALGDYFHDPRLHQLFGRYATYCGSSPYQAPATLMLVAHVEQQGVWIVDGGMHALAQALADCATAQGASIQYEQKVSEVMTASGRACGVRLTSGETIAADAVIVNGDVGAVANGLFGATIAGAAAPIARSSRSLSAITWSMVAKADGFPLSRHSVFFSRDYAREFTDIFGRGEVPDEPTVYVCGQHRIDNEDRIGPDGEEELFVLINAPPIGDKKTFDDAEIARYAERAFGVLARCGLRIARRSEATTVTTPSDFERMFPATGGALYGRASHGWTSSFARPGARTKIPGLYLAGGSTHPGPGVPMAALSGRAAAASLLADIERDLQRAGPAASRRD